MVWNTRYKILFGILAIVLSRAGGAAAEIMFEGYSVIRAGQTPIGFTVQRYEYDSAKKQFISISFLKTNPQGNNITESIKAVANESLQPVSFQYTAKTDKTLKIIDAKFAKDTMTATIGDGKTSQTVKSAVKKGTFLSTFLGYLMLQKGYKVGNNFTYSAIAEEEAQTYTGEALIKAEDEFKGQKVFRITNNFKGAQFVSFVTPKGEILGTTSPLQGISTELMATPAEATKGLVLPTDSLKLLFGSVPAGKVNVLAGGSGATPAVPSAADAALTTTTTTSAAPAAGKSGKSGGSPGTAGAAGGTTGVSSGPGSASAPAKPPPAVKIKPPPPSSLPKAPQPEEIPDEPSLPEEPGAAKSKGP
jgi:hypothetical protein